MKGLPIFGAIISAILGVLCCVGPAVLAVMGVSAAGLSAKIGPFHTVFVILTFAFLAVAFYFTYRKREVQCEDGSCKITDAGKWNKIFLWIGTALVLLILASPYVFSSFSNTEKTKAVGGESKIETAKVVIPVEGMTCTGCERNVESAVKKLNGVINAKADYKKGICSVKYQKGKVSIEEIVDAINKSGYRAKMPEKASTSKLSIPVEGMTCHMCEAKVERAVKKLDGVIDAKADYKKGICSVKYQKGEVSIEDIIKAINRAGYKAKRPE